MNDRPPGRPPLVPTLNCLGLAAALLCLCLLPFVLVDVLSRALEKLHLTPPAAGVTVVLILLGGLVNIPVYRVRRDDEQPEDPAAPFVAWVLPPNLQRYRHETVIAVNFGGCVVPAALAGWLVYHLSREGGWPLTALGVALAANTAVCYAASRPVRGVGVVMPGLLSPLTAVGATWLLLLAPEYEAARAPVAFVAGVLGPLLGADLLRLRDVTRVEIGMLSIGGAGTFDGIVLSGVLAAFLA